jgi:hypothetical protein
MHFSRVKEGRKDDLELRFSGLTAMRWADECYGSITDTKKAPFPKTPEGRWAGWTYPLLIVNNSTWLANYQELPVAKGRRHFYLVSMNDLVDVLALPNVEAKWISPS